MRTTPRGTSGLSNTFRLTARATATVNKPVKISSAGSRRHTSAFTHSDRFVLGATYPMLV